MGINGKWAKDNIKWLLKICIISAVKVLQDNWEGQVYRETISVWGGKCANRDVWGVNRAEERCTFYS